MSTSRVLYIADDIKNVAELKAAISLALVETRIAFFDQKDASEVITFGRNGAPLRIRMIEDTLTDGSKVYNLNIEDVQDR